ncbi:two-component regulator propeller domain-containing protein [Chitinophaga sp. ARDCPP14]|uniref:two-component regulator propeller domain-containing protein n=1 Tax=Chitinophaga sp. ARDCPP14 TaxID=3391139 RepID=UPI003F524A04
MWFGGNGLSRYDGKSFQNFTTKDGLPNNGIKAIMEDKTGKLWIATWDGPCFYDGKTFTVLKDKDGKVFKNVWSIIEDEKGNIWTTGSINPPGGSVWALSRYDAKSLYNKKPAVTEILSRPPAFLGLLEANDGSIWFGSGGGVHRYDGKTFTDFKK